MKLLVVDERKELFGEPYVLRVGGWTLERYLEEAPDNLIWEYVRGEVVMYSPATAEHQDLVGFLYWLLRGYCEAKGLGKVLMGPAAVRILPDVVREPDIFVIAPEDIPKAKGVPLEIRPILVVEVVSPSTRTIDLREKALDYAEARIPEYWAVDPHQKEIWVHRLGEKGYDVRRIESGKVESLSLPGFHLELEWVFREPLPSVEKCLGELLGKEG